MSSKDDVFLEEARLGPRTRVLIECEEIPDLSRLRRRFREYVLTDLAHAVMLTETGIVAPERGASQLEGLLDMHDSDGEGFPWLAESGSFLVQTEHHLGQRIGDDIAGRLQTGRSRNDQSAAGGAPSLARGQRGTGGVGGTRLDSPGPGIGPKLSVDRELR